MGPALKFLLYSIAFILAWTLLILLLTAQLTYGGAEWTSSLVVSSQQLLPWMFVSPLILIFSLWFPILDDQWWLRTLMHIGACLIIILAVSHLKTFISELETVSVLNKAPEIPQEKTSPSPAPLDHTTHTPSDAKLPSQNHTQQTHSTNQAASIDFIHNMGSAAPLGVPLYISILLITTLNIYRQELYHRDQDALRLETQLTQTQLNLLRSQLQPHFLFNTLNAISCLIYSDPDKADSMVLQLSDLLRSTLDQRDATFIHLKKEIETIQTYLNIQSTRFGDRIIINTSIAKATHALSVPPMILLPLAENAVRYGVEKSTKPTTILIESRTEPKKLILSISDDGPGIDETEAGGTGVGLTNTTNRLLTLYPEGTTKVTLEENAEGLTVATIELPLSI